MQRKNVEFKDSPEYSESTEVTQSPYVKDCCLRISTERQTVPTPPTPRIYPYFLSLPPDQQLALGHNTTQPGNYKAF